MSTLLKITCMKVKEGHLEIEQSENLIHMMAGGNSGAEQQAVQRLADDDWILCMVQDD